MKFDAIIILDFGSQYTQLIARRIREMNVYCEIHPYNHPVEEIKKMSPKGIIFSGGPSSVYDDDAPKLSKDFLEWGCPILGICYGAHLLTEFLGGKVQRSPEREFGYAKMSVVDDLGLFDSTDSEMDIWMSHSDKVTELGEGCLTTAKTDQCAVAAFYHPSKKYYGLQFHPEVHHTRQGELVLKTFVVDVCGCSQDWTMECFVEYAKKKIQQQVGSKHVICGLSGGVDSSVTAVLLHEAIGDQLTCIFVDNGLLRQNEVEKVLQMFRDNFRIKVILAESKDLFLDNLKNVIDPEMKRKVIGELFVKVFEKEAKAIPDATFLAQGTLYPDVIESVSVKGPSDVIKSHHNVGGLPEKMNFELVEPLRELFKDEVRDLGKALGLSKEVLWRHPFPGPGLAIRVIGEVTEDRLAILRMADEIILEEIKKAGVYDEVWQAFGVLLPVKTVGVMGDNRTYENVLAVRVVESQDGMTASWVDLDGEILRQISSRVINEVVGINRVVYDISSKPPSTIEWE
ncbi:glutamine-hydrolyzing GMP synthase [PVC group bacterium (ex Bugula neritina AB1)]|nr:glutamine-hydrolyzing GMP synthase [PVC group bacterium (ex Bugula neritina AB1)]